MGVDNAFSIISKTPYLLLRYVSSKDLFGVYGLVRAHFAREEEVYLPILDQRLTPDAAQSKGIPEPTR